MRHFSTRQQLGQIASALQCYMRLPLSPDTIPGGHVERLIAHIHDGEVLGNYDFVDVINRDRKTGWQVKSTKESTPVTWKRAKIPNAEKLIAASRDSAAGVQRLGDSIIEFCNRHVAHSFEKHGLETICFSRLILFDDGRARYYERHLCSRKSPELFSRDEFAWRWSAQKQNTKKEQKQALHGIHRPSGRKWFAAHILGENQLHFAGEQTWWPAAGSAHAITFSLPAASERLSLSELIVLLERREGRS